MQCELTLTPEQEELATIAGLILHERGLVPGVGETMEFPDFYVTIEKIMGARIAQVGIRSKRASDSSGNEPSE